METWRHASNAAQRNSAWHLVVAPCELRCGAARDCPPHTRSTPTVLENLIEWAASQDSSTSERANVLLPRRTRTTLGVALAVALERKQQQQQLRRPRACCLRERSIPTFKVDSEVYYRPGSRKTRRLHMLNTEQTQALHGFAKLAQEAQRRLSGERMLKSSKTIDRRLFSSADHSSRHCRRTSCYSEHRLSRTPCLATMYS